MIPNESEAKMASSTTRSASPPPAAPPPRASAPGRGGALARLAHAVLAHRRLVVAMWAIVFLAGAIGAGQVSQRLSFDFSLPRQPGYETAQKMAHLYGNGGESAPSLVGVTAPAGQSALSEQQQIGAAFAHARAAVPRARIVDYAATHNRGL